MAHPKAEPLRAAGDSNETKGAAVSEKPPRSDARPSLLDVVLLTGCAAAGFAASENGYGFRKVGCIPFAFDHPTRGLVDTYPARVRKQSYSINILWER
jgi:hypothetical protein